MSATKGDIQDLVYASCLALDREDYESYMQLFTEDMRYRVVAYSPELRKDMVWLDHDTSEMQHLIKMLPQHVTLKGKFFRHATVYEVEHDDSAWNVLTSLMLTYTGLDGSSNLMAVGHYEDKVTEEDNQLKIDRRTVRLETRDLGPGIQVPL